MYRRRETITLRQFAAAVGVSLVLSILIYFVSDVVWERMYHAETRFRDASDEEIKYLLEKNLEDNILTRFNKRNVQANSQSIVIELIDDDACDKGLSAYSKTAEIDLRTLMAKPSRVELRINEPTEYRGFGLISRRAIVKWRFDQNYRDEAQPYVKEFAELWASAIKELGRGEAAIHEATSRFLSKYDEDVLRNWEFTKFCSGRRSIEILEYGFILSTNPDPAPEIVELVYELQQRGDR